MAAVRRASGRRADLAGPPGPLRRPIVSSWRPERVSVSSVAARAISTRGRGTQNRQYARTRSGYSRSYPLAAATPDRSGANSQLDCANNERPAADPHSPVNRAVHAGGSRRHDWLGHRRRADRRTRPPVPQLASQMMRGCFRALVWPSHPASSRFRADGQNSGQDDPTRVAPSVGSLL